MLDSVELSQKIESLGIQGKSHITFVIGGSIGTWKRGAETLEFCAQLFQNDISASVDAGNIAGTDLQELPDHEWAAYSQMNFERSDI